MFYGMAGLKVVEQVSCVSRIRNPSLAKTNYFRFVSYISFFVDFETEEFPNLAFGGAECL